MQFSLKRLLVVSGLAGLVLGLVLKMPWLLAIVATVGVMAGMGVCMVGGVFVGVMLLAVWMTTEEEEELRAENLRRLWRILKIQGIAMLCTLGLFTLIELVSALLW